MQICSSCFHKSYVNEEEYYGNNRLNIKTLETTFYCCGRIPSEGSFRRRHGMCEILKKDSKSQSSLELAVEAFEDDNYGDTKIVKPEVPFIEDLPEELYQGRSIEIYGKLSENPSRFSVNLSTGKSSDSDLALHFNPRFDRHVIIRNHRIKNKWGVEEITSLQNFPFTLGRHFSILIFVADEQFLIAVNKIHFCAFAFRIPVDRIKSLIIVGDIILSYVKHIDRTHYPPKIFKKTPFIIVPHSIKNEKNKCYLRRKIKTIKIGSKVEIFGRLKILPRAFYINLQKGISVWPHPNIPFHLNCRLHLPGTHKVEKEVIFNSWLDGFWGKEEIITFCPFLPGLPFHLLIICNADSFNVHVNDKFLFNFSKRSEIDIDSVFIHGDVIINKVLLH